MKKYKFCQHLSLNFFAWLILTGSLMAQGTGVYLAPQWLIQALKDEISGEIAFRYTADISRFDRIQASEGWHEAAIYIKNELGRLGYKDANIESWPSDGSIRYGTYRSVIGWRVKNAELWLVSPVKEKLCSHEEIPLTVVKHSGSGRIEAELVDAGSGLREEDYVNKDVKGKIVLAYGATSSVMREAVAKRGALGVLTYFPPDVRPGYPNMIRYTALWPKWEDREKSGFAFNLSKNQGAMLKRMLEEGKKVTLKADIVTEFFMTQIEILTATLPGKDFPDEEVIIVGHLCHPAPSANDNASGSGTLLEIARALKKLADQGIIPQPSRTIRFLWVPEFNGLMPYVITHLERIKKSIAVINCDMVGEDLHKTSGFLTIYQTPDSLPTFLNDVMEDFARLTESLNLTSLNGSNHPFLWKIAPYEGGSDHVVFNDGSVRVPAVMLNRSDIFHHTSLDTIDKVDPTELRRAAFVAGGAAYYLANASDKDAVEIARRTARNGYIRLVSDFYTALSSLNVAMTVEELVFSYRRALNIVNQQARKEINSVLASKALSRKWATEKEIESLTSLIYDALMTFPKEINTVYRSRLAGHGVLPRPIKIPESERLLQTIIPSRTEIFIGPVAGDYLEEKVSQEILTDPGLRGKAAFEAVNFVDGKRTLHDIFLALWADFDSVKPEDVKKYFNLLEKAGLIRLNQVRSRK